MRKHHLLFVLFLLVFVSTSTEAAVNRIVIKHKIKAPFTGFKLEAKPVVSEDGKHIGFVSGNIWIDGKTIKPAGPVRNPWYGMDVSLYVNGFFFSPSGGHYAYAIGCGKMISSGVNKGRYKEYSMVIDGHRGPVFDDLKTPCFNRDGKRSAYAGLKNGKWRIVIDGRQGPEYDKIDNVTFSPDGKRIAYVAINAKKAFIVINGAKNGPYTSVESPVFSQDNRHFGYIARNKDNWFVVIDGKQGKAYKLIKHNSLVFSPDGKRTGYTAVKDGEKYGRNVVVIDGKESKLYDNCSPPVFSPNGKRISFSILNMRKTCIVVDGRLIKESNVWDFIFSPDSRHTLYGAGDSLYLDGKRIIQKKNEYIMNVVFTPDSKHYLYASQVSDNKVKPALRYSSVVVDGKPGLKYDMILNWRVYVDAPGKFHYYAVESNTLYRVDESIK